MSGKFPCTEARLVIALSPLQTAAHNITEFSGVIPWRCPVSQDKVRLDDIVHILQYHGRTLLYAVLCTQKQIGFPA